RNIIPKPRERFSGVGDANTGLESTVSENASFIVAAGVTRDGVGGGGGGVNFFSSNAGGLGGGGAGVAGEIARPGAARLSDATGTTIRSWSVTAFVKSGGTGFGNRTAGSSP